MAQKWHTEDLDLPSQQGKQFSVYLNGADEIKAKFTAWENDISPKEIEILTTGSYQRRFAYVKYCDVLNRIEIHYVANEAFTSKKFQILDRKPECKIDPTLVIALVEYQMGTPDNMFEYCKKTTIGHPEHKKGSIIVRNP
ncbi:hypothetical protein [Winogradskyella sp. 3972H.M.0a.05]|uniref:hypothetical protein n=1 Tax=Winogradskyella sp. 3972H.M.0a.05 TaxID=2950277 RepID=UPI0033970625